MAILVLAHQWSVHSFNPSLTTHPHQAQTISIIQFKSSSVSSNANWLNSIVKPHLPHLAGPLTAPQAAAAANESSSDDGVSGVCEDILKEAATCHETMTMKKGVLPSL
jgi:hypothetical protein